MNEFRQREEERERAHRAKVDELSVLGEELKATIAVVSKRQKQLQAKERDLEEREKAIIEKTDQLSKVLIHLFLLKTYF